MFSKRSDEQELMDDLSLSGEELRQNLTELTLTNRLFGSQQLLIKALDRVYQKYSDVMNENKIVIGDLGSGSGDLLLVMNNWAEKKKLSVELIGFDANPAMIEYAKELTGACPNIKYRSLNIFSPEFKAMKFDIITINSFTHHFNDHSLIALFSQLGQQVRLAIIINDLQRHWISYYSIKWLSRFLNFSYLARHDGCLSVLRAFRRHELSAIFRSANIHSYEIRWRWAFRWEMIVWLC